MRKAVKANRPANLEAYIIAYCYAMQKGEPAPILPPSEKEKEQQEAIEGLMNHAIRIDELPADLEISDVLTEDEKPKVFMRDILVKLPKREDVGPAFHEKKAKNKKVNIKISHKEKMMAKYGKPKKRAPKK